MINYLSLFSGIGSFEKAMKNLGYNYNLVGFSEIDKFAIKSYCLIHNVDASKNLGDITKIDVEQLPKNLDLITYGFPCQDISLVGKQKGLFNEDGSVTRSGLFFEALKVIEATKPRVAIAENVKMLVSKKFTEQFNLIIDSLKEIGYRSYVFTLNAKNYGIPQHRERVFIISIREDIDDFMLFFENSITNGVNAPPVSYYLEEVVDEKYFLSDAMIKCFIDDTDRNGFVRSRTFKPLDYDAKMIYAITTKQGNRPHDNYIIVPEKTRLGNAIAELGDGVYIDRPHQKRGVVQRGMIPTLRCNTATIGVVVQKSEEFISIRRLTPLECFRLMGFNDSDYLKVKGKVSDTQLYKQCGNSIVVPVAEEILSRCYYYLHKGENK